jgi:hypothetical protein
MNGPAFYLSWCYDRAALNVKQSPEEAADIGLAVDFVRVTQDLSRYNYRMQGGVRNAEPARVFFSTSFVHYGGGRGNWNAPDMPTFSAWGCDSLDVLALRESNLYKVTRSPNNFFR